MPNFKDFLICENKYYLGQKTGDLLTAVQSLMDDAPNIGNRAMIRAAQGIINQIRRILHGRWDDEDLKYLKQLQKIGVALAKAIDSKENMDEVIAAAVQELEDLTDRLEVPVNTLGSEEEPGQEPTGPNEYSPGYQLGA